uniref:C-type lectin domain-containing protein n=1 Tax=Xiphophorus couchianus TaxID=32473 RepID=A0A3B5KQG0_9TELE
MAGQFSSLSGAQESPATSRTRDVSACMLQSGSTGPGTIPSVTRLSPTSARSPLGFSWNDARHYCQSVRTELTSIHSRAEIEFIRNLNFTKKHNIWIGLTRDRNCELSSTYKTSLGFVNWAQGEPNSAFHPGDIAEENCVEMYLDGHWNDNNCLQKRGFACRHRQCKEFLASFLWIFYFEF